MKKKKKNYCDSLNLCYSEIYDLTIYDSQFSHFNI